MRLALSTLAALLLLPLALQAEDAAKPASKFAGLKVEADDTTFIALPEEGVSARKKEILKEAKEAEAKWTKDRDAFAADRANKGQQYLEPKPEPTKVSVAKTFTSEAEAKLYAETEQREAEGKYAVISITGLDGTTALETLRQNKIKAREAALGRDFLKQKAAWQKRCDAHYAAQAALAPGFAHQEFRETKPLQPKLAVLKKDFPSKEEAMRAQQELKEKGKK